MPSEIGVNKRRTYIIMVSVYAISQFKILPQYLSSHKALKVIIIQYMHQLTFIFNILFHTHTSEIACTKSITFHQIS